MCRKSILKNRRDILNGSLKTFTPVRCSLTFKNVGHLMLFPANVSRKRERFDKTIGDARGGCNG